MPRTMTSAALQELLKIDSGEPCFFLFTLNNPGWSGAVRLVDNPVEFISNGDTFSPYEVSFVLPREDTARISPKTKFVMGNTDLNITKILRGTTGEVNVNVKLVISSVPDHPIYDADYLLTGITYNEKTIEGSVVFNNVMEEQIPCWAYTPAHYPGLFGA